MRERKAWDRVYGYAERLYYMEYNKDLDLEFLEDLQNLFRRDEVILRELHKLINEVKLQIRRYEYD
ncbi:hypothetical protein [Acidianus infernus]|uniref:hypothetical protein n=1 Tax=Acidianus infernus TaxID=12915 RepID=UPI0035940095